MYNDDEWDKIVDEFEGRKAVVYCTDGASYKGVGGPYCEEEDENGVNTWAITLDMPLDTGMIFMQSDVERIEYLD